MKPKLIYSCEWGRNKETSWSGTNQAVYSRLYKNFDVINFDFGIRKPFAFIAKVIKKLTRKKIDVEPHYSCVFEKKFKGGNAVFQFGMAPAAYDSSNKQFIYQDLSWENARRLLTLEPAIFEVSGYADIDKAKIADLANRQLEFYRHDNVYCLTMGHWLSDFLVRELGVPEERVCFVGGGCNINASKIDHSKKTGDKFLFVGKDFERKNGPLVIRAFRKLRETNPTCELYIAGPTNLHIEGDGIHVLGRLTFDELVEYFNLCDVFVMPSRFEAYGIVFGEALSFGLPCIGRDAYEMPYFIQDGENGYLLKNQDDECELTGLMKKAIENKTMREFVKANKTRYLDMYSWDAAVERMSEFIKAKAKFD